LNGNDKKIDRTVERQNDWMTDRLVYSVEKSKTVT